MKKEENNNKNCWINNFWITKNKKKFNLKKIIHLIVLNNKFLQFINNQSQVYFFIFLNKIKIFNKAQK